MLPLSYFYIEFYFHNVFAGNEEVIHIQHIYRDKNRRAVFPKMVFVKSEIRKDKLSEVVPDSKCVIKNSHDDKFQ